MEWTTEALSPGIKLPEREAERSPPTGAKIRETWICTSTLVFQFSLGV
jgi:hypothetical protein